MIPLLHLHSRRRRRFSTSRASALLASACVAGVLGCGEISCPEGMSNVGGLCQKVDVPRPDEADGELPDAGLPDAGLPDAGLPDSGLPDAERCDGIDNDGDQGIDEDWPELGQPCGESGNRGECRLGEWACAADGLGVVCEGAVDPVAEVCDGKDNDCDDLIDEQVLSVKQERFSNLGTVSAIDGGFAVTRIIGDMLRMETYRNDGTRTGHHDDLPNPSVKEAFLESDASAGRVVVALGQHQFHVIEAQVDSELVPIILGAQRLHEEWNQGIDWGIYNPPYHPRVSASPRRFLGHRDLVTFALSPFANGLGDLAAAPAEAKGLPYNAYFDAAGAFAVWEQYDNVRAGWLMDDGAMLVAIDVGRGGKPAVALADGGPGVAYVQDGKLLLSELGGATLQCRAGGFCGARIDADPIEETATTAMALGFDEEADTWVLAAGEQLLVLSRGQSGPIVKQRLDSSVGEEPPVRIDVALSDGTAAIVQTGEDRQSALTFMGCF